MKTQKDIEKDIEKLEKTIRFECKKYCKFEKLSQSNKDYEIKEWLGSSVKLGELKALLQQSKEFIERIEKRKKKAMKRLDFCKKHSKKNGDYNDNESFRALSVYDDLEELKSSIIGSEEKLI